MVREVMLCNVKSSMHTAKRILYQITTKRQHPIANRVLSVYLLPPHVPLDICEAKLYNKDTKTHRTYLIAIVPVAFSLYMLPSILALAKRNHRTKVILFNLFLGWTIVMWIISLVWACKREEVTSPELEAGISPADELKKYKELLDAGVISEKEFEEKKNQLLGI